MKEEELEKRMKRHADNFVHYEENNEQLKKYITEHVNLEDLMESVFMRTFTEEIILLQALTIHNNIEMIEFLVDNPKFINHHQYNELIDRLVQAGVSSAAKLEHCNLLHYYEKLQEKYLQADQGFGAVTFTSSLSVAVSSLYDKTEIFDFLLSREEKYNKKQANFTIYQLIESFEYGHMKKYEYIKSHMYTHVFHDDKVSLFRKVLQVFNKGTIEKVPAILEHLIFEEKIPLTKEIEPLVNHHEKVRSLFWFRDLHNNLNESKESKSKVKI